MINTSKLSVEPDQAQVGIFLPETALVRPAGSVLIDVHEEWIVSERRDLWRRRRPSSAPSSTMDTTAEFEPAQ